MNSKPHNLPLGGRTGPERLGGDAASGEPKTLVGAPPAENQHSTHGYTDAQRQADGIRQLIGYIVNETPQDDAVDEYERKIDKWLDVWAEKHDGLLEQYAMTKDIVADLQDQKAGLLEQYEEAQREITLFKAVAEANGDDYRRLKEQLETVRETLRWFASERGFTTDEQDARVRTALGSNPASEPDMGDVIADDHWHERHQPTSNQESEPR